MTDWKEWRYEIADSKRTAHSDYKDEFLLIASHAKGRHVYSIPIQKGKITEVIELLRGAAGEAAGQRGLFD